MERLARTPYMRNLWLIMKTFNVLPTNKDFRELSDDQIDMMIYSFKEDAREAELARKGLTVESEHFDASFEEEVWNADVGKWEVLKEGHDPNEIAKQVEMLTRKEDLKNLAGKFDSLEEYNKYLEEGGKPAREMDVERHIDKQIALAMEKARQLEAVGGDRKLIDDRDRPEVANNSALSDNKPSLDKDAIDKSIALFNSMDDDDEFDPI
ncbi:hypothetical protein BSP15_071 [Bacillus phage BSP15]|uniref:Tail assembly chaperone n=3 Tax=Nitunavirus TaxID=1921016 RepID=U5PU85_BPGRA|nr:tail assembly chaperone [Bacillus phage phiNIT1]YP_008771447.1 tail assembly chaperone [Bacillus phage Grass]AYJ74088.1 hypothetical protein BSP15_071 [Bacillus phage BSP15]AYJ75546.1 hypothetical protein BSP21_211 [Bacillus phage BSP21]AYJ75719.1 hypothetical protein BSP18_085 [Bacillus phage BSP18]QRI44797.1 RNA polymerase [Bacillus phage BSTP3]UPI13331.1 hypothetical protein [Bacillus phage SBSphiJ7]